MRLPTYEPFKRLRSLHDEIDKLFGDGFHLSFPEESGIGKAMAWSPAVDVAEEDDHFEITADIPGVNAEEIEVTVDDGLLTIKGERESDKEESREGYQRVERFSGTFQRTLRLPESADLDKIEAKSENGVLHLSIAKTEKAAPRRISVKT